MYGVQRTLYAVRKTIVTFIVDYTSYDNDRKLSYAALIIVIVFFTGTYIAQVMGYMYNSHVRCTL